MSVNLERSISSRIRMILAELPNGEVIPEGDHLQDFLDHLEFFVPRLLEEVYDEWKGDSLDGIFPIIARKTGDREIELFGLAILMSDQKRTPLHLRLKVAVSIDELCWLECRLGQRGRRGMIRFPNEGPDGPRTEKHLYGVDRPADQIDWVYKIAFGSRDA
jgi:hypothetical protein